MSHQAQRESHGLAPWIVRLAATRSAPCHPRECHGLAPWIVTLRFADQRESPRGKPVASSYSSVASQVAASVSYHGASPWHHLLATLILLFSLILLPDSAAAQSLWELTPYRVHVYLAVQDAPQLTEQARQDVQNFVTGRIESLVGASWNATVSPASPELAIAMLRGLPTLATSDLPEDSLSADKVILLCLSTDSSGYRVAARELDCRTRLWGTTVSRIVGQPALLTSAAVDAVLAAFAPLAEVEDVEGSKAELRLRAAALPLRDPKAIRVGPGTLFRPVIRFNDREGRMLSDRPPQVVPWTCLLAREAENGAVQCEIFTGLRSPLSARRRGRTEQLAVAVRPPEESTRLVVHSRVDKDRKLFGYDVHAYAPDESSSTLLGRTDLAGSLEIPPGEHPLRILVIKSGAEFLARLPIIPGVEPEVLAGIPDDDDRLAVEGYITGLQEEIVDIVALRATLMARIRARLNEEKPEEAKQLVTELRQLRTREDLAVVLNDQRRRFYSGDSAVRRKVDKLFNDTREVMVRNLDPSVIDQLATEVDQALKSKPAAPTSPAKTSAAASAPVR